MVEMPDDNRSYEFRDEVERLQRQTTALASEASALVVGSAAIEFLAGLFIKHPGSDLERKFIELVVKKEAELDLNQVHMKPDERLKMISHSSELLGLKATVGHALVVQNQRQVGYLLAEDASA